MNVQFQNTLSDFEARLNALLASLTTSPTAAAAPAAALSLLDADDCLTSAVQTLRRHQANYARILELRAQAESLEDRVKGIVRDVVGYEREVREVCGDEGEEYESSEEDDDIGLNDSDTETEDADRDGDEDMGMGMGVKKGRRKLRRTKEVEYKLLLDFARRISKYNLQAAADAAEGLHGNEAQLRKRIQTQTNNQSQEVEMTGTNTNGTDTEGGTAEPVSSVTKDATLWLDKSADEARQIYMLPYPMEDRIRMGLMGQIQLAAAEGRPDFEADAEVERLIREAEGSGVADAMAPVQPGDETRHADEAAMAAAHAGSAASVATTAPPKPKAMLDLDLYDPDEDDM